MKNKEIKDLEGIKTEFLKIYGSNTYRYVGASVTEGQIIPVSELWDFFEKSLKTMLEKTLMELSDEYYLDVCGKWFRTNNIGMIEIQDHYLIDTLNIRHKHNAKIAELLKELE